CAVHLHGCTFNCSTLFSNAKSTTQIYTLSLHDALPISESRSSTRTRTPAPSRKCSTRSTTCSNSARTSTRPTTTRRPRSTALPRSEEHTSELQSQSNLVCRLLLEKKKKKHKITPT